MIPLLSRIISERFRDEVLYNKALYTNRLYFTVTVNFRQENSNLNRITVKIKGQMRTFDLQMHYDVKWIQNMTSSLHVTGNCPSNKKFIGRLGPYPLDQPVVGIHYNVTGVTLTTL